jgi:hypothetical protein
MERAAIALQRAWRGCVDRLRYQRLRHAAIVVQATWRGVQTRRSIEVSFEWLRSENAGGKPGVVFRKVLFCPAPQRSAAGGR